MKYTIEAIIQKPAERVMELFDDPQYFPEWIVGFVRYEMISGEPRQRDSRANLYYMMGEKEIEMLEITLSHKPNERYFLQDAGLTSNLVEHEFESIAKYTTRYRTTQNFKFYGFMKVVRWIMPGAFRRMTQRQVDSFKAFVERMP